MFILVDESNNSTQLELATAAACCLFIAAAELRLPDGSISLVEPVGYNFVSNS